MADKRLQDFPLRADADDNDLLLVSSQAETYKIKFSVLRAYVAEIAREALNQVETLRNALSYHVTDNLNSAVEQQRSISDLEAGLTSLTDYLFARTEEMAREYQGGDTTLEGRINELQDRITALSVRIEEMNINLNAADAALTAESRREDATLNSGLLSLESRVGTLESSVSEGQSALERSDQEILSEFREGDADLSRRLGNLQSVLEARIQILENRVNSLRITNE